MVLLLGRARVLTVAMEQLIVGLLFGVDSHGNLLQARPSIFHVPRPRGMAKAGSLGNNGTSPPRDLSTAASGEDHVSEDMVRGVGSADRCIRDDRESQRAGGARARR